MKLRTSGLVIAVVCVLCAIVTASASASEVSFALTKGKFPATYTLAAGATTLEVANGSQIDCTSMVGKGTLGSATEGEGVQAQSGTLEVQYKGCKGLITGSTTCETGSTSGEIVIPSSEIHLGLVGPETPAILGLLPGGSLSKPLGGKLAFRCSLAKAELAGDLIGALPTLIEQYHQKFSLNFEQNRGKQLLTSISLASGELTGQHLTITSKAFSGEETLEMGVATTGSLENFKNSAGELIEVEVRKG